MVAAMPENKEKLLQRLCEEPILYFEAYKLLGNEEEAEKVSHIVLERMMEVYPDLSRRSYDALVCIGQTVIHYLCGTNLSLVNEINREDVKNESISNEERFLALIRKCGGDVLLQVLAEMPEEKKCVLTLKYAYGLDAAVLNILLGLSHQELLKELESSRATMITKMENLYECQKNI